MKAIIVVVLVVAAIWFFLWRESNPKDTAKVEQKKEQVSKPEATVKPEVSPEQKAADEKRLAEEKAAAEKAKAEKEAVEKATRDAKLAEEAKSKAEADAKLAAAEAEKDKALKAKISACEAHMCNVNSVLLTKSALSDEIKQKAINMSNQIESKKDKYLDLKKDVDSITAEYNKLKTSSNDKVKIGWKYTGSDYVYTMNEKPSKKDPVKWVYGIDQEKVKQVTAKKQQLDTAKAQYEAAKKDYEDAKDDYAKLSGEYNKWLTAEVKKLKSELNN